MIVDKQNWEEPMAPSAMIADVVCRFKESEDFIPTLYVNKCFARAMMVEMVMYHGANINKCQIDDPKHFAFGDSFIFINDKLFPQDKIDEIFYIAAFKKHE